jgi:8-hydroxy-5-deazaflavin:NADPH oxidoreductase
MQQEDVKSVGIIGAGRLGQAMARTALRAGRRVVLANSRGPESLAPVVAALGDGASAGTVEQAAGAPTVVLAVPWERVTAAVRGIQWDGRIVIDATNDFAATDFEGNDLGARTSSELVAEIVSGARVVKGANTLVAAVLGSDPHEGAGQRVIFLSGDDVDAKSEVRKLFEDAGFSVIDLGDLVTGGRMQQVRAPLAGVNLIRLPDGN